MNVTSLPLEVIANVIKRLDDNALKQTRLVNHFFNNVASPYLHDSIAIAPRYFDLEVANKTLNRHPLSVRRVTFYEEGQGSSNLLWDLRHPKPISSQVHSRQRSRLYTPFDYFNLRRDSNLLRCEYHRQRHYAVVALLIEEHLEIEKAGLHRTTFEDVMRSCPALEEITITVGPPKRLTHLCSIEAAEVEASRRSSQPWDEKIIRTMGKKQNDKADLLARGVSACTSRGRCLLGNHPREMRYDPTGTCAPFHQRSVCSPGAHFVWRQTLFRILNRYRKYWYRLKKLSICGTNGREYAVCPGALISYGYHATRSRPRMGFQMMTHNLTSLSLDIQAECHGAMDYKTLQVRQTKPVAAILAAAVNLEDLSIRVPLYRGRILSVRHFPSVLVSDFEHDPNLTIFRSITHGCAFQKLRRFRVAELTLRARILRDFVREHPHVKQVQLDYCVIVIGSATDLQEATDKLRMRIKRRLWNHDAQMMSWAERWALVVESVDFRKFKTLAGLLRAIFNRRHRVKCARISQ